MISVISYYKSRVLAEDGFPTHFFKAIWSFCYSIVIIALSCSRHDLPIRNRVRASRLYTYPLTITNASSEFHLCTSFEFFYYHWSNCQIHPLCEFWVPPLLELRFQIFILPLLDLIRVPTSKFSIDIVGRDLSSKFLLCSNSEFKFLYCHCWIWSKFRVYEVWVQIFLLTLLGMIWVSSSSFTRVPTSNFSIVIDGLDPSSKSQLYLSSKFKFFYCHCWTWFEFQLYLSSEFKFFFWYCWIWSEFRVPTLIKFRVQDFLFILLDLIWVLSFDLTWVPSSIFL